jgi:hypothetical protein
LYFIFTNNHPVWFYDYYESRKSSARGGRLGIARDGNRSALVE